MKTTPPRKKQGSDLKPAFIEDFEMRVFERRLCNQHKKAGHGFAKKSQAANAAIEVVELEAGRSIQSPMINLVIGVNARLSDHA